MKMLEMASENRDRPFREGAEKLLCSPWEQRHECLLQSYVIAVLSQQLCCNLRGLRQADSSPGKLPNSSALQSTLRATRHRNSQQCHLQPISWMWWQAKSHTTPFSTTQPPECTGHAAGQGRQFSPCLRQGQQHLGCSCGITRSQKPAQLCIKDL